MNLRDHTFWRDIAGRVSMFLVGAAPVAYLYCTQSVPFKYFIFGSGSWGIGVMLKMILFAVLSPRLNRLSLTPAALIHGLNSGLTELGSAALFFYFLPIFSFDQLLAFGVGIGAIEAIVLSMSSNVLQGTSLETGAKIAEQMIDGLQSSQRILFGEILPVLERVMALVIHVATRGLVYQSVYTSPLWFLAALVAFVTVDGMIGYRLLRMSTPSKSRFILAYGFMFLVMAGVAIPFWYLRTHALLQVFE